MSYVNAFPRSPLPLQAVSCHLHLHKRLAGIKTSRDSYTFDFQPSPLQFRVAHRIWQPPTAHYGVGSAPNFASRLDQDHRITQEHDPGYQFLAIVRCASTNVPRRPSPRCSRSLVSNFSLHLFSDDVHLRPWHKSGAADKIRRPSHCLHHAWLVCGMEATS